MCTVGPCQACSGTGKQRIPCLPERISQHAVMYPEAGLVLTPAEVAELARAIAGDDPPRELPGGYRP